MGPLALFIYLFSFNFLFICSTQSLSILVSIGETPKYTSKNRTPSTDNIIALLVNIEIKSEVPFSFRLI